jgi:hypothetical protein
VKETLSEMLSRVSDQLAGWLENKQCSQDFISAISNDLRHREASARSKVMLLLPVLTAINFMFHHLRI